MPEHLCSTELPNHLCLRDKDGSKSAQPMQYVGLKKQPLFRALSPTEDGHFCVHMNLQPCQLKLSTEKWVGHLGLDLEASGRLCFCRSAVTEGVGDTRCSQRPASHPPGPLCTIQVLDGTGWGIEDPPMGCSVCMCGSCSRRKYPKSPWEMKSVETAEEASQTSQCVATLDLSFAHQ